MKGYPEQTNDRLGVTLIVATLLHGVLIFGLTYYKFSVPNIKKADSIEITIAKRSMKNAPKDAEYIAQANQEGGGEADKKENPRDDSIAQEDPGEGDMPLKTSPEFAEETPDKSEIITTKNQSENKEKSTLEEQKEVTETLPADININEINDVAKLEAIYYSQKKAYSKKKRHKIIDPSTMSKPEAGYLLRWQEETQKVGNANYPQGEQYRNLFGDVLLEIIIDRNGELLSVKIIGSSGSKVLDDTAMRTVKMAAPFPKFGKKLRKELDSIQFLRTFKYKKGNVSGSISTNR